MKVKIIKKGNCVCFGVDDDFCSCFDCVEIKIHEEKEVKKQKILFKSIVEHHLKTTKR